MQIASNAASREINTHVVRDAGRTQIAPGSKTILCLGPGEYCSSNLSLLQFSTNRLIIGD